ncbi:MAG: DNA repair protein RecN [Proteobacteria bacterium]|nr:DNA repair protein RecN [Pseudomonadota bacterium]
MLVSLDVRDLAVIDAVSLELGAGLTALTGETGAGKSILLDALGLATGQRADSSLVRTGAERATVAAVFEVAADHEAVALLEAAGIACSGQIVVRRQVGADGRSRAFVNDDPVGVALLAQLGAALVEVHGQHDQRDLLRPEAHRTILDGYGGHGALRAAVAEAHAAWAQARDRLAAMQADADRLAEREGLLRGQVEELDALEPVPGEEEELAALRSRLGNAQKIAAALAAAGEALEENDGPERRLRHASAELARVREVAGGALEEALAALDRALLEVNEAQEGIARVGRDLDADAGRLEATEERLFALRGAARRHNTTVAQLPEVRQRLAGELAALEDREGSLVRLAGQADVARAAFDAACDRLSAARRKAATRLDKAVAGELAPLRMDKARFETTLQLLDAQDRGREGAERVLFQVATNPGGPAGPLNRIASGGELSRFMLALKVVAAGTAGSRTLVFDEIDSGIGGAVSDAVGERLQKLGQSAQVLVVTHAPQVAARAASHIRIVKTSGRRSAATDAVPLDADARREELARMLAGATITDEARAAAASLLKAGAA